MTRRGASSRALPVGLAALASARIALPLVLVLITVIGLCCARDAAAVSRRARSAGVWHVVERGQTLFRISEAYRVPVAAIVEANRLKPKVALRVGQRLRIPGAKRTVPVPAARPLSHQERETLEQSLREDTVSEAPKADLPAARVKTDAPFVWPIL